MEVFCAVSPTNAREPIWKGVILKARLVRLKDLNDSQAPQRIRHRRFCLLIPDP